MYGSLSKLQCMRPALRVSNGIKLFSDEIVLILYIVLWSVNVKLMNLPDVTFLVFASLFYIASLFSIFEKLNTLIMILIDS